MAKAQDGAICRVKLTFGTMTADQARGIAYAAKRFGNGIIDITNRANLQIRGVRPDTENALTEALLDLDLGPLTDNGDDVRNVMISPVAGLDQSKVNIRPLAMRVLTTLQTNTPYLTLSPKFCLAFDGGESIAPTDHPHDLWLSAIDSNNLDSNFAFGVAGIPPIATEDQPALGVVGSDHAFDLVTAMLDLFIEWNRLHPEASRLRHMLAHTGSEKLTGLIEERLGFKVRSEKLGDWRRALPQPNGHLGIIRSHSSSICLAGAMPPLGRLNPDILLLLAGLADTYSAGRLQLTPWQSVLLPGISTAAADAALQALVELGFSADPQEPIATMISCSGSAGCGSALAATQSDGLQLVALLNGKTGIPQIHMSGCGKSCASPLAKPLTLVATAPGHYDIFLRTTNGPSHFGKLLASNRTIEEAADLIGTKGF